MQNVISKIKNICFTKFKKSGKITSQLISCTTEFAKCEDRICPLHCNFIIPILLRIWEKEFKNGPSKICGRQPLKNLKGYGLLKSNATVLDCEMICWMSCHGLSTNNTLVKYYKNFFCLSFPKFKQARQTFKQ